MLGLWDEAQLALCFQTCKLWHSDCFYVWQPAEATALFPFFYHVGGLLCRQVNLPNCIAFIYSIFLRAFLCRQNFSKGTESLQTSSPLSCNYGDSAATMKNKHSGPSTRTHAPGELRLMRFKQGSPGSCYWLQLWAASHLFLRLPKQEYTSIANRSTSSWDDDTFFL